MPGQAVPTVAGEYYHVYNRGNNRQPIFFEQEYYSFFLRRVRERLLGEQIPADVSGSGSPETHRFCTIVA